MFRSLGFRILGGLSLGFGVSGSGFSFQDLARFGVWRLNYPPSNMEAPKGPTKTCSLEA